MISSILARVASKAKVARDSIDDRDARIAEAVIDDGLEVAVVAQRRRADAGRGGGHRVRPGGEPEPVRPSAALGTRATFAGDRRRELRSLAAIQAIDQRAAPHAACRSSSETASAARSWPRLELGAGADSICQGDSRRPP